MAGAALPWGHAAAQVSWAAPMNGLYSDPMRWMPMMAPTLMDDVTLGLQQPYTVSVSGAAGQARTLSITNPLVILEIDPFVTMSVDGDIGNEGIVVINAPDAAPPAALQILDSATIGGSGFIVLGGTPDSAGLFADADNPVTHAAGHTISGAGRIQMALTNNGEVSADVMGRTLLIQTSTVINNAELEAAGGGTLELSNTSVSQGAGGTIAASGAGSRVDLRNATVIGGELSGAGDAEVGPLSADATIGDITVAGTLSVPSARTLRVAGTLTNDAVLTVNTAGSGGAGTLFATEPITLGGTGSVVLNAPGSGAVISGAAGASVTNSAGHTITGRGIIQTPLINNGEVVASVAGQALRLQTAGVTNNLSLAAQQGAELEIVGITVAQGASGVIGALGTGSVVDLITATIEGGLVGGVLGGVVQAAGGNATFRDLEIVGDVDVGPFRTLAMGGTITNDGAVLVNTAGGGGPAAVRAAGTLGLQGTGQLILNAPPGFAVLDADAGVTLANTGDHVIRGRGSIRAELINDGLISADRTDEVLELAARNQTNLDTIQAVDGATLRVSGIAIGQGSDGLIGAAGAGSVVDLRSAEILGGTLATQDDGLIRVAGGNANLLDVTLDGRLEVGAPRTLSLEFLFENNGTIVVNDTGAPSVATLETSVDLDISGTGKIVLNARSGSPNTAVIDSDELGTVTNGAQHAVFGTGEIRVELNNHGDVVADVSGEALRLVERDKVNSGSLGATAGGTLEIAGVRVTQTGNGQIVAEGGSAVSLVGAAVEGGTIGTLDGGRILLTEGSATIGALVIDGEVDIGPQHGLTLDDDITNDGVIVVNVDGVAGASFLVIGADVVSVGGSGFIVLNAVGGGAVINGGFNSLLILGPGQAIRGVGRIDVRVQVSGSIAPGGALGGGGGVGTLSVTREMTFDAGSGLDVEVAGTGPGQADLLSSTQSIHLGGTLRVGFVDGFAPQGTWAATVATAPDLAGRFAEVETPPVPPGLAARAAVMGTELRVGWFCQGDFDMSGTLDILDVLSLINAWSQGDPRTDFDGSGTLNILDVVLFIAAWNAGCP